jgi:hypothetical protein
LDSRQSKGKLREGVYATKMNQFDTQLLKEGYCPKSDTGDHEYECREVADGEVCRCKFCGDSYKIYDEEIK